MNEIAGLFRGYHENFGSGADRAFWPMDCHTNKDRHSAKWPMLHYNKLQYTLFDRIGNISQAKEGEDG